VTRYVTRTENSARATNCPSVGTENNIHANTPHRTEALQVNLWYCTFSYPKLNSTQLYCKQARGPNKNKEKKERKKITKKHKKHTHKYAQRVSHTYKSLRHFANIGERQKRSQLTKAWVISLLHEHSERSSENCCLRTAAKKVIAPCWTNN